jgi:hypothetical protein
MITLRIHRDGSEELARVDGESREALRRELTAARPTADVIIITAANHSMAEHFASHLIRLASVTYNSRTPVVPVPDPVPGGVGNGAAMALSLQFLGEHLEELAADHAHLEARSVSALRIVIVQAGGLGTRYTMGPSDASKVLMPLPLTLPNGDQATMLDVALTRAFKFTRRLALANRPGLVVLAGDGNLITDAPIVDGIALITNRESIRNALGKLGVAATDRSGRIVAFL